MGMLKNELQKVIKKDGKIVKVQRVTSGKSLTQQCFKNECDVIQMLEKHKRTGIMRVNKGYEKPLYDDFSGSVDYKESCNLIIKAEEQFMSLPSGIRKKFDNDPAEFLAFCENPENADEMIKLGLREPIENFDQDPVLDGEDTNVAVNEPSTGE